MTRTPAAGKTLSTVSFCTGICAPEIAWRDLGWRSLAFSEIDPFARAVEAHRFPDVPNLGDMTAIDPAAIPDAQIWCAGTPCQSFSVAGLRGSLSDTRGNLTLHFVKLIHARHPFCVVWENVPGVLSTKDNAFGCFLAGLVGEGEPLVCRDGSWPDAGMVAGPLRSAAWRILDAQYFGLAQRRRRVFVISFRAGDGINPGAVLFEPESVPRDIAPSREAGTGVAGTFAPRTHGGGGFGTDFETDGELIPSTGSVSHCLNAGGMGRLDYETETFITENRDVSRQLTRAENGTSKSQSGNDKADSSNECLVVFHDDAVRRRGIIQGGKRTDVSYSPRDGTDQRALPLVAHSLRADGFEASEDGTGRGTPLVPVAIPILEVGKGSSSRGVGPNGAGIGFPGDPMYTLQAGAQHAIAFDTTQITSAGNYSSPQPGDPCHPLASGAHPPAVAFAQNQRDEVRVMEVAGALASEPGMKQQTYIQGGMAVRRLTPRECERLQGFPDDYTAVPYRGKPASDGPRYRALGNSMAVPVLRWIGERIAKVLAALPERSAV